MNHIFSDNDLRIFAPPVTAGMTKAPDLSDVRRGMMAAAAEAAKLRADDSAEAAGSASREAKAAGITHVIRPKLVHGKFILNVTKDFLADKDAYVEIPECDGLITDVPGVVLTSTHGDCIPVYAWDTAKNVIGLAHAGWKGTKLGIAGELIRQMKENYGSEPGDIRAFIGPGIGRCHFEVRDDVMSEFLRDVPRMEGYYDEPGNGKYLIDLKGINAEFLRREGVTGERLEISGVCTYCSEEYYSYRKTGTDKRMLAYIMIERQGAGA